MKHSEVTEWARTATITDTRRNQRVRRISASKAAKRLRRTLRKPIELRRQRTKK